VPNTIALVDFFQSYKELSDFLKSSAWYLDRNNITVSLSLKMTINEPFYDPESSEIAFLRTNSRK
jgi:hypothetical protein